MFFYNLRNLSGLENRKRTQHSEAKIGLLGYFCISKIKNNNSGDDNYNSGDNYKCSWMIRLKALMIA